MRRPTKIGREAQYGRHVLAILYDTGLDAGDRLSSIVREAVRLGLARENADACEDADPWALPPHVVTPDWLVPRCDRRADWRRRR